MTSILDSPLAQAMLRAAGDDPTDRVEALEQIIIQHENQQKLQAAIRSALLYPKIVVGAATVAGLGGAVWLFRRV
jgi:type II secretory pathway component PulF